MHRFEAVLGGETGDLPGVVLPADVAAAMGGRARIPVAGAINGVPFRGSTMPMGDGRHCVGFRKELRAQAGGVEAGDARPPHRPGRRGGPGADRVEIGAGVARACVQMYRKICFETCLSIRAG
jgi:hypothetical protein